MKDFFAWVFWGSATALSFAMIYGGFSMMRGGGDELFGLIFFVIGGGLLAGCISKVVKRIKKRAEE